MPDDILGDIFVFVGEDSYVGFGATCRELNKTYKIHSKKRQSSFEKFGRNFKYDEDYSSYVFIPYICKKIADYIVSYGRRDDLLRWVLRKKNKYLSLAVCVKAVEYGHLDFLKSMLDVMDAESLEFIKGQEYDLISIAVCAGRCKCLEYLLHEYGCSFYEGICEEAASFGKIECLKYLHELGCPLDENVFCGAARGGSLDCLRYLHEHDCPWTSDTYIDTIYGNENNCLEVVKFLHEYGCPWDVDACEWAARCGNIECLKYLHEQGCPWDDATSFGAVERGNLDCLEYAHSHGCPWSDETCIVAASDGRIECLKYLHEQGCPWTSEACECAARHGHFECLRYMRENGLEWDGYDIYLDV